MTAPEVSAAEPVADVAAPLIAEPVAAARNGRHRDRLPAEPSRCVAAEPEPWPAKPATSVPEVAAARAPDAAPASAPNPHRLRPPPTKARTPWFAIFTAGILGAGLTAVAAGAAWIYLLPLIEPDTSSLNARLTRLEMHTPTAAEIAAATVPDMGKVPAAKIDELAARLAKLEAAEAATARQAANPDGAKKLDDLTSRVSRLETAPPAASPIDPAELKELGTRIAAVETAVRPLGQHLTEIERQSADHAKAAQEAQRTRRDRCQGDGRRAARRRCPGKVAGGHANAKWPPSSAASPRWKPR